MSFKGLQKGVARAPQILRQRLNIGEITSDTNYQEVEQRLCALERELEILHFETKRYRGLIENLLNQQIEFARKSADFYSITHEDGTIQCDAGRGGRACIDSAAAIEELLLDLKPDLDSIETRITVPIQRGLEVIKAVRRTTAKRNHKQLDHDRRRAGLKKLQEKPDRTLRDEKALYKAENDAEQATQDFNYFNDLLKQELPVLFGLEQDFVAPILQSFYLIQMGVYYRMYAAFEKIDTGSMDLRSDIEAGFLLQRGGVREKIEGLAILHSRNPDALAGESRYQRAHPSGERNLTLNSEVGPFGGSKRTREGKGGGETGGRLDDGLPRRAPPPYPSQLTGDISKRSRPSSSHIPMPGINAPREKVKTGLDALDPLFPPSQAPLSSSAPAHSGTSLVPTPTVRPTGAAPSPPPRPRPVKTNPWARAETATALFPFTAQTDGDLSFETGDVIEVVKRSENANEWWVGRLRGKEGQFPGNYVRLD